MSPQFDLAVFVPSFLLLLLFRRDGRLGRYALC